MVDQVSKIANSVETEEVNTFQTVEIFHGALAYKLDSLPLPATSLSASNELTGQFLYNLQ